MVDQASSVVFGVSGDGGGGAPGVFGRWVEADVPGVGRCPVWVPESSEACAWTPELIERLALFAARWVKSRVASTSSREHYLSEVGLPYLLARLGDEGRRIAEWVQREEGVRVPVRAPSPRHTSWHLTVLPFLAGRRIDPWGPRVCAVMDEWGRALCGLGDVPDHVWEGDEGVRRTTPLADATIRTRAAITRSYYRWHHAAGLTACSPADIWTPRAAGVPAAPMFRGERDDELDRDDMARLLLAADRHEGVEGDRELCAAVIALLIATGMRALEVCRANVTDYLPFYRRGAMLRVHGKGNRERLVPLDAAAVERIDRWLLWRPDLDQFGSTVRGRLAGAGRLPHRVPLFVPIRGAGSPAAALRQSQEGHAGRLHPTALGVLLRRVATRADDHRVRAMAATLRPHSIRAAVATCLIDEDTPLHQVAGLLGHSSLTTTARYDRRQRDRHLTAAATAANRQAAALEQARRAALTR